MAQANNIFGRKAGDIKKAFSADSVSLKFGNVGNDGHDLIVQQLQVQYTQQVSKIYDISGTTGADAYYVAGRAEGQATLQKVIGPNAEIKAFYELYGDVCKIDQATDITLTGEFGCGDGSNGHSTTITLVKPVVVSFGMAVNAQDVIITESTSMIFHSLHISGGTSSGGSTESETFNA